MAKVLVLYCSGHSHIEAMAKAVAKGARESGATVDIKRVPVAIAEANHGQLDQQVPMVRLEDLANYDAVVLGADICSGCVSLQMTDFLNQASMLWGQGALRGKVGGVFTSTATLSSGQDATRFAIISNHCQFEMVVTDDMDGTFRQIKPGSIAGRDVDRQPSERELAGAHCQGYTVARIAKTFHR